MISDARGGHVSPGIYSEEKDVTYSVKSLGITNLGLVGETLYGPAFENIPIKDWSEFIDYFGGTSPEKFKGTDLPKYELPYIAKSYLEESKQLNVVRVLGLSGYEAGPAYIIKDDDGLKAILRSKMIYGHSDNLCSAIDPDNVQEVVNNISVGPYHENIYNSVCGTQGSEASTRNVVENKFSLTVTCNASLGYETTYTYNVSLNPNDGDYILNVLGDNPTYGTSPIYVECVFSETCSSAVSSTTVVSASYSTNIAYWRLTSPVGEPVDDYYVWEYEQTSLSEIGAHPMTVMSAVTGMQNHSTNWHDADPDSFDIEQVNTSLVVSSKTTTWFNLPKYIYKSTTTFEIIDAYTNYHDMYRPAQTPWVVSNIEAKFSGNGEAEKATMNKLFKFITISDGNASNYQVKVTISRINPIDGTFDVIVRDYNDTDDNVVILEKFSRCNLVPTSKQYIANKIGTYDGTYESRSKYITVAMAADEGLDNLIPAGFLGYPMPSYKDTQAGNAININYNTVYDTNIKPKRQYFGLASNNIIPSIFSYKGKFVYSGIEDSDPMFLTNGFHMDSILCGYTVDKIYVNGIPGYTFTYVSTGRVGSETRIPRLINANYIYDTIYNDINVRKFTMCFYGGFDGWDVHEASRTNTDEYNAAKYITNKRAKRFTPVGAGIDGVLNLPSNAITSDYYAYLAGYRVFSNPQDIDINIFATPGIDWYNNRLLTEDVINIIEDSDDGRGGDALYIINSPRDLTVNDITYELEMSEINTSYGATYYPWIKYYDSSNGRYIEVSPTKDVVRNLARTDNNSFPWFAPAGMDRGSVNCVRALYKTTLADEDELYANRVNPVKTFSRDGVKIWGNKTLYTTDSPLNRINVRRLMIRVKKLIVDAAKNLIFEQYDDTLEKQFRGLVEPILADVKANRGISDYRIMTEVTPETRDEHILPAKILIKPTPALEYISITFVVYPQSVSFEE